MENEEDIFGDDQIKPNSFYSNKQEKTKLNWFCYELALSFDLVSRVNWVKNWKKDMELMKRKLGISLFTLPGK